jgi:hypothetical protein
VAPTPAQGGSLIDGEEGSLILTLIYDVLEKNIINSDLKPANFKKLIGRPIDGNDVVLKGTISGTEYVEDFSPYTATVAWTPGSKPAREGKFSISDVTASVPMADVTLLAKDGFKFEGNPTIVYVGADLGKAVAIDGPASVDAYLTGKAYSLSFTLDYSSASPTSILRQITSLDGIRINQISNFLVPEQTGTVSAITSGLPAAIYQVIPEIVDGLVSGNYPFNSTIKVKILVGPNTGYTFKSFTKDCYFTESAETRAKVLEYLEKVYDGTSLVGTDTDPRVTIGDNDITLLSNGVLEIVATYKTKPQAIVVGDFTLLTIGDFPAKPAVNVPVFTSLTGGSPKYTTSLEWSVVVTATGASATLGATFTTGNTYIATITVEPLTGYTFVGVNPTSVIYAGLSTAWGSGNIFTLAPSSIIVTGVQLLPTDDTATEIKAKDEAVITITFSL